MTIISLPMMGAMELKNPPTSRDRTNDRYSLWLVIHADQTLQETAPIRLQNMIAEDPKTLVSGRMKYGPVISPAVAALME